MAIVKSLFGEYFDWAQNLDFSMAEIVGFVISHEKMSARLTIKPYKKFEKDPENCGDPLVLRKLAYGRRTGSHAAGKAAADPGKKKQFPLCPGQ